MTQLDNTMLLETRDGRPARVLGTNIQMEDGLKIAVAVRSPDRRYEHVLLYLPDGQYYPSKPSDLDLVTSPVRCWLNIYPDGIIGVYRSKEGADASSFGDRICCLEVEEPEATDLLNNFDYVQD